MTLWDMRQAIESAIPLWAYGAFTVVLVIAYVACVKKGNRK